MTTKKTETKVNPYKPTTASYFKSDKNVLAKVAMAVVFLSFIFFTSIYIILFSDWDPDS